MQEWAKRDGCSVRGLGVRGNECSATEEQRRCEWMRREEDWVM